MPIPFHYRFDARAAFLAAAAAAGWPQGPDGEPFPPEGGAVDEIGPLIGPPSVGPGSRPIPGALIDARFHVNLLWPGDMPHAAFAGAQVTPDAPSRAFAIPPPSVPVAPAVPGLVAAWKGKAVLASMGLLDAAEAAVDAAGGVTAIAWRDAAEWERGSEMLAAMAAVLGLTGDQVDDLFRQASAIKG